MVITVVVITLIIVITNHRRFVNVMHTLKDVCIHVHTYIICINVCPFLFFAI